MLINLALSPKHLKSSSEKRWCYFNVDGGEGGGYVLQETGAVM